MDRLARTRLEQVIRESDQSAREHCDNFNRTAVARQEYGATLSYRQLTRWMSGTVAQARAASMRVAEWHWGEPFAVLIGPPRPRPQPFADAAYDPAGTERFPADHERIGLRLYVPAAFGIDQPAGTPIDCGTFAFALARVLAEQGELVAAANRAARAIDPTVTGTPARQAAAASRLRPGLPDPGWIFPTSSRDRRDSPAA